MRSARLLWTGVALLFLAGIFEFLFEMKGEAIESRVSLWGDVIGYYFIIVWIYNDSRKQNGIVKPFDYGYLIFLFSPVYIPYYFWKTRRWYGIAVLSAVVAAYGLMWTLLQTLLS